MTDPNVTHEAEDHGTAMVCFTVQAAPLKPQPHVRHNASYVAQLIASAADVSNIPRRRSTDKAIPLAAYAPSPSRSGRTRRLV